MGLEEMQLEEYRIVPWDQDESVPFGVDREFYIPPEIERIAREVMTQYDMQVSEMTLITSKPDKGGAIWQIMTDKGPRSLKVLHREPRRSLFSVYAQQWLVDQGARVPALIKTRSGSLYVEAGQKLWIVTDWIPLVPASKVGVEGAEELVFGLGEFHRSTRGYVPPNFAKQSSRIHHWPKYYSKMIEKIGWIRDLARAYPDAAGSEQLLSVVDEFERQAKEAVVKFENSSYRKMIAKGESYWGLVHQDYGFSNGQVGEGGIWVIDLDGVAYDFPIRDLRKMITSMMDDMGIWDPDIMRRLIQAYHRANPIDRETYELLVIDMMFPNEFYKHIKEMIFDPLLFMNTEMGPILDRVLATQASKESALAELERDLASFVPGDYEEVSAEERRAARKTERFESVLEPFDPQLISSLPNLPSMPGAEADPALSPALAAGELSPALDAPLAGASIDGGATDGWHPVEVTPLLASEASEEPQAQAASPVAVASPSSIPANTDGQPLQGTFSDPMPIPASTAAPSGVGPRRAVRRSNRTFRRRKRVYGRRGTKRPTRARKAKPAVRKTTSRKPIPKRTVARKPTNARRRTVVKTKVRKVVKTKVRKAAGRARA
jgi:CotS family spore coat protein